MANPTYDADLFNFVHHNGSSDEIITPEFKKLRRLNLIGLQNDLADLKDTINATGSVTFDQRKQLRELLREYKAIQDLEYISKLEILNDVSAREQRLSLTGGFQTIASKASAPYNMFYLSFPSPPPQACDLVREILRKHLHSSLSWSSAEKQLRKNDYFQKERPEKYSRFVDRLARFIMAFVGGAALLVPMVIMVFNASLIKSLVTTCVAVLLFAGFLAFGIAASNQETLVATVTYAAVVDCEIQGCDH